MWDKDFRICIFVAVYQHIFSVDWENQTDSFDWNQVFGVLNLQEKRPDEHLLSKSLSNLLENQTNFETILQSRLQTWKHTYGIVKAILLTFLQEVTELRGQNKPELELAGLISKYIQITREYIGGENVVLVHAITSKILAEK